MIVGKQSQPGDELSWTFILCSGASSRMLVSIGVAGGSGRGLNLRGVRRSLRVDGGDRTVLPTGQWHDAGPTWSLSGHNLAPAMEAFIIAA